MTKKLERRTLPGALAPGALSLGVSRVKLLAFKAYNTAVNPMMDGMFSTRDNMLEDVMGWAGKCDLSNTVRTVEEDLVDRVQRAASATEGPTELKAMTAMMERQGSSKPMTCLRRMWGGSTRPCGWAGRGVGANRPNYGDGCAQRWVGSACCRRTR